MQRFRVWIRPLGEICRVRVEGLENTRWLLGRLGRAFVFKSCEPIQQEQDSCSFQVPYDEQLSRAGFEKLLAAIPEVHLLLQPA